MPTGPGEVAFANPRPRPPTTAVPQSGPMTRRPRAVAVVLSATSWSMGTLSLKTMTSWPASSASIASTNALAPGTDTRTRASPLPRSAAAVVRWGATSALPASRRVLAARAALDGGEPGVERPARPRAGGRRPGRSGVASGGTVKPISVSTSTLSGVAMATWAAATPGASCTLRLTWSRVTESAYAPLRSSTCVFVAVVMRRGLLRSAAGRVRGGRRRGARRRRWHRLASGRRRGRLPRACRARTARRPARAAPRRAGRSPAGSRTAAWSGRRCSRTARSTSGVGTPAGAVEGEPAAQDVVAERGQSVAAADHPGHGVRVDGLRWSGSPSGRGVAPGASRGVRTSTDRPTASGLPSRWRTPSATYAESKGKATRGPGGATGARTGPGRHPRPPGRRTGRRPRRTRRAARDGRSAPARREPSGAGRGPAAGRSPAADPPVAGGMTAPSCLPTLVGAG